MPKKSIALATYTLNSGGVSMFIFNLAEYFAEQDYLVDIIPTDTKGVWFNYIKNKNINFIDKTYSSLNWLPFGFIIKILKLSLFFRSKNYASIIVNCSESTHLTLPFLPKATKTISVIHNNYAGVIRIGIINNDFIDHVICVSPSVELSTRKKINTPKLGTILNGVKIDYNYINDLTISDKVKIIFVGRLIHEQKGVLFIPEILKELIKKNVDIHLTIVGSGPDQNSLFLKIKEYGLTDKITYHSRLTNNEVYKLYKQNHIFLMPSFYEGLPLALMESMSMGCVPIVNNLPLITDVCIDDSKNGYIIENMNIKVFSQRIYYLSNNPLIWKSISENARKKALEEFDAYKMGRKYLDLIESKNELKPKPTIKYFFKILSLSYIVPQSLMTKYYEFKIKKRGK